MTHNVFSIALSIGWTLHQIDIQISFLHGLFTKLIFKLFVSTSWVYSSLVLTASLKITEGLVWFEQAPLVSFARLCNKLIDVGSHDARSNYSLLSRETHTWPCLLLYMWMILQLLIQILLLFVAYWLHCIMILLTRTTLVLCIFS